MRAPVMWYGGKGNMLKKLMPLVPPGGRPYCEPYMGAASLFFARDPAPVEVLNDLDQDLVNLFRCLQDPDTFKELAHRLTWTLYSRAEFARAIEVLDGAESNPVMRAWAKFVGHNMAMSAQKPKTAGDWGRTFESNRGMALATSRWNMRLSLLEAWHSRLMRVQIDCRDALEVIRYWDNEDAVFYIDPPYHPDTRVDKKKYVKEASRDHHARLVETLLSLKGKAVLSGYAHPVYALLEQAGWQRIDFKTACHTAVRTRQSGLQGEGAASKKVPRIETVWINPAASNTITLVGR